MISAADHHFIINPVYRHSLFLFSDKVLHSAFCRNSGEFLTLETHINKKWQWNKYPMTDCMLGVDDVTKGMWETSQQLQHF